MTDEAGITSLFWNKLRSDRTVMLGVQSAVGPSLRPMTAQLDSEADAGPIWFFTSTDSSIVRDLATRRGALFTFASDGHDVFATVHGQMSTSTDRAVVDRLWNRWVAAWYDGGKDDEKLILLRFEPERAEIWRDGSSLLAGLTVLFGSDPKDDYKDNVAKVSMA